jgi:hypothetical protein
LETSFTLAVAVPQVTPQRWVAVVAVALEQRVLEFLQQMDQPLPPPQSLAVVMAAIII